LFWRLQVGQGNEIEQALPAVTTQPASAEEELAKGPDRYAGLFRLGHSVNGFDPLDGNSGQLMANSNMKIVLTTRSVARPV
jgi:cardiolipin synthase